MDTNCNSMSTYYLEDKVRFYFVLNYVCKILIKIILGRKFILTDNITSHFFSQVGCIFLKLLF